MSRALIVLFAAAVLLAGCHASVSIGDKTVSKAEVEKEAQAKFDQLAKQKGEGTFPPITCNGDLEAKVGATQRCSATFPDGRLGITVTCTGTSGSTAHMHFQADAKPTPLNAPASTSTTAS